MGSYEDDVRTLEVELGRLEEAFGHLSDEQWQAPTKLRPLDETQPHWTVFELARHFDISIGLTVMLMAEPQSGQVGRDRTSFFIFSRSEVAPVVYDYAFKMVEGKTPQQLPDVLHETFTKTIQGAQSMAPETVGPGYYALMRLDEFVPSRSWRRWCTASTSPTPSAASRSPPRRGGGDCGDPRRPAGSQDGPGTPSGSGGRPGVGPGRVGKSRPTRPSAATHRMT